MPAISCSAPGKIILCGEHAVVYSSPAIAIPVFQVQATTRIFANPLASHGKVLINSPSLSLRTSLDELTISNPIRATIDLVLAHFKMNHLPSCEISINSRIPIAAGLGSSAAVSISLIRSLSAFLGHSLEEQDICQLGFEAENFHHNSPSGIDNTVITYQCPIYFKRSAPFEYLKIPEPVTFLIADSGIQASTADAVLSVQELWSKNPDKFGAIFNNIGDIVHQVRTLLEAGKISDSGPLLTRNHELLQEIAVSSDSLDRLVEAALQAGALGAKLSGGGIGGNVIALVDDEHLKQVENAVMKAGAKRIIITTIPNIHGNQK